MSEHARDLGRGPSTASVHAQREVEEDEGWEEEWDEPEEWDEEEWDEWEELEEDEVPRGRPPEDW